MLEMFGERFVGALKDQAESVLGTDHPCTVAASQAAITGDQLDVAALQQQMSALPPDLCEELLKAVHKTLREDPAALLDVWSSDNRQN